MARNKNIPLIDQLRTAEEQLTDAKSQLANSYVSNNNLTAERNKLAVEVEDYKAALQGARQSVEMITRDRSICREALEDAQRTIHGYARRLTAIAQAAAVVNTLSAG